MKKMIVSGILTLSAIANAAPAEVYDGRVIRNNTNSPVLRDSVETNRIYVLPPKQGKIAKKTENLFVSRSQCENLAIIEKSAKELTQILADLAIQQFTILRALSADKTISAEQKAELRAEFTANDELIRQFRTNLQNMYDKDAVAAAGYIHLEYATAWDANVKQLQNDNSGFSKVTPLIGQNVQISMHIETLKNSGAKHYIDYAVNGINSKDLSNKVMQSTTDILSTDITLTTLGACYFKYPSLFGSEVKPSFSIYTTYDIPRTFAFDIDAKVNLWKVYSYLNEQGSSGGLFSSRSWSETVESDLGGSSFDIDWSAEDPEDKISSADQIKIANEIKVSLLSNLATIISQKAGFTIADKPGATGASMIADELGKIPDPDAQAAAISFRILNAVLGNSSSTTSYKYNLDVTATHNFSSKSARYVKYTTAYTEN